MILILYSVLTCIMKIIEYIYKVRNYNIVLSSKSLIIILLYVIVLAILFYIIYKNFTENVTNFEINRIKNLSILPNLQRDNISARIYTTNYKIEGVIWDIFSKKYIKNIL